MTDNERITITTLNEIARAICDIDARELNRLCGSKLESEFAPKLAVLECLFRERIGPPLVCKTAAAAMIEAMFAQHSTTSACRGSCEP